MESSFSFLNSGFFTKAEVYPGSLGTFRYRFKREGWIGSGRIQAWVYENTCFELAEHIETETFDWTEEGVEDLISTGGSVLEGVEALRSWLDRKLSERGTDPYRIPIPGERSKSGQEE